MTGSFLVLQLTMQRFMKLKILHDFDFLKCIERCEFCPFHMLDYYPFSTTQKEGVGGEGLGTLKTLKSCNLDIKGRVIQ